MPTPQDGTYIYYYYWVKKVWLRQVMSHGGEPVTTTLLMGHSTNPTLKNLLVVSQSEEVIVTTSPDTQGFCLS